MSWLRSPDRILQNLTRMRFVVTTKAGQTWDGLVMEVDDYTIVLRDVEAISADGARVKADGEVLVPRGDVAYMQRP